MATCALFPGSHCQCQQAVLSPEMDPLGWILYWLLLHLVMLIDKSRLLNDRGLFCSLCYHCGLCQFPQVAKNSSVDFFGH